MLNETEYNNNPLSKEQENQIDALFNQFDTTDKPGCSVGVIQDGGFIYKKSFGMANLDYDIPITSKSKFKIGSITKEFTASCIALLALEGKLNLDDKVIEYIPEMSDYAKSITIRNLLYHTSGLRDYLNLFRYAGFDFDKSYSREDSIKILFRQKSLDFEPGEIKTYSNSGYLLLAKIVNLVSGKSLKEYSDELIFKPLGMDDTFYISGLNEVIKNKVIPYKINDSEITHFIHNLEPIGAGGMYSTIDDFLKWDNNFNDPKVGGLEFLELIQKKGYLNNNAEIEDYGMGFMHGEHNGRKWIGHGGAYFGFRSFHMRFPEFKTSIIIMANREDTEEYSKSALISDILLMPTKTISTAETKTIIAPVELLLSLSELEKFCGHYWCEKAKLNRKIYLKEGKLFYWREENNESSSNELIMADVSVEAKLIFSFDSIQKTLKFFENDKLTSEFISYEPPVNNSQQLDKVQGRYYSEELDEIYNLKSESGKLFFYIKDQKISELVSFKENIFECKEWGSFFEFKYNEKSELSKLILNSERASGIIFVKQ